MRQYIEFIVKPKPKPQLMQEMQITPLFGKNKCEMELFKTKTA